jgi:hypothetical protein
MVAERLAFLDHLTHGRLIYGFGGGGLVSDKRFFHLDANEGSPRLKEALGGWCERRGLWGWCDAVHGLCSGRWIPESGPITGGDGDWWAWGWIGVVQSAVVWWFWVFMRWPMSVGGRFERRGGRGGPGCGRRRAG